MLDQFKFLNLIVEEVNLASMDSTENSVTPNIFMTQDCSLPLKSTVKRGSTLT